MKATPLKVDKLEKFDESFKKKLTSAKVKESF